MWLCASGCAVPVTHGRFAAALPYATAPLSARAKIFLVAGGSEVANFAEEVVAQRRLWLARGFAADEIACYWARPSAPDYRADLRQYRRLARDLRGCYAADARILSAHMRAQQARGLSFVYLYVTSHGSVDILPEGAPQASLLPHERDLLDQYAIQLGAGVGRGFDPAPIVAAVRRGAAPDDLVLSPRALQALLRGFPADTAKVVVLQACHSGGFLADPARAGDTLAAVPRLTAIAAARHDRTSFGCQSGAERTYFGDALLRQLARRPGGPAELDWTALFVDLRAEVDVLEARLGVRRSLPVLLRTP
jgi:hypothetical protein